MTDQTKLHHEKEMFLSLCFIHFILMVCAPTTVIRGKDIKTISMRKCSPIEGNMKFPLKMRGFIVSFMICMEEKKRSTELLRLGIETYRKTPLFLSCLLEVCELAADFEG